jgi:cytochrome c553
MIRSLSFLIALTVASFARGDDFTKSIQPIFAAHCIKCHGPDKQKGGLRLDRKVDALKGGDTGVVIKSGKPGESLLMQLVSGKDPDRIMPPGDKRLTAEQIRTLSTWIEKGAVWPVDGSEKTELWWSFRPIVKPAVPSDSVNPIDAFIRAKQKEIGLKSNPEADRRTLLRRVSFDLTGLPPTFEEMESFTADQSPDAYSKIVDRLLATPAYGERWARHWLDVVRYGETHGYDKDQPRPNAWRYRDYVIRAFNEDRPYSRFVREQIAGDVLFPHSADGIEATGFLAAGPWDLIGHAEVPESKIDGKIARHLDRDDFVSNAIGTFVGLTAHCAQCHNHKFDPISQEDYYRLQAVFAAIDRTDRAYDVDPKVAAKRAEWESKQKSAQTAITSLAPRAAFAGFAEITDSSFRTSLNALTSAERELRNLPAPHVAFVGAVHTGGGTFVGTGANGGKPRPIHLLARGDVTKPGVEVGPGAIPSVPGVNGQFNLPANHAEGARRVALADWIVDQGNPLTWRVIVNRVWQYHFGRGLVETPNDFGKMGRLPSHPELLDYLATDFREHQSLKRLHRLIVTSETYRQSSAASDKALSLDADNKWLARQNRRKLEAEELRDAMLLSAGVLNRTMGGPSFRDFAIEKPEHSPHYNYQADSGDDPATYRRSIYRFIVRSQPQPFLAALDCADPSVSVDRRNETLTSQQALALLNNRFSLRMAEHFAKQISQQAKDDAGRTVLVYHLALNRDPTPSERLAMLAFVKEHGLVNACRVMWNLNEFAFVD